MDDIDRVVAGLSGPMKRALLWLPANGDWREHRSVGGNDGVSWVSLSSMIKRIKGDPSKRIATIYALVERRLNGGVKERGALWPNSIYRATPLGQAVRRRLMETGV